MFIRYIGSKIVLFKLVEKFNSTPTLIRVRIALQLLKNNTYIKSERRGTVMNTLGKAEHLKQKYL